MAEEDAIQQLRAEASSPTTDAQRLEVLSTNPSLRNLVAGNPATPVNLLEHLAGDQDEEVRKQVASNPNTPWKTLEHLAAEFPQAFLHNPIGPLQMLAHPEQMLRFSVPWGVLLSVAPIPPLWWNWLQGHSRLFDIGSIEAMHLHVQSVGEAIHPYGIAHEGEEHLLLLLVQLLTCASVQGVSLPPLPANSLPGQTEMTGEQILEEHLRWLARAAHWKTRQTVAANHHAIAEVLHTLAQDPNRRVREKVAWNQQTPVEILKILAQDPDWRVRRTVGSNKRAPVEILSVLALDQDENVRMVVASNPQTPTVILQTLALDQGVRIRYMVARNPQTPAAILQTLALDQDENVRRMVARNPQTPAAILQTLALDKSCLERMDVASNPRTPEEVLRMLSRERKILVLSGLAHNQHSPVEVLRRLARYKDRDIRHGLACNPHTPVATLHTLALDQDATIRLTVAENEQTPVEVLQMLARDQNEHVRMRVVFHRQVPAEMVEFLTRDRDGRVQRAATFIQRLTDEGGRAFHQQGWWETFRTACFSYLFSEYPATRLDIITELDVSEHIREILLVAFATVWDALMMRVMGEWRRVNNYRHIMAPFMPALVLQKLATSSSWKIRYLVALHEKTSREIRQRLSQDGNRYVRAMARAKAAQMGETTPSA